MVSTEKEVKIARILIIVSVIFGLFVVMALLTIGIGDLTGRGGNSLVIQGGEMEASIIYFSEGPSPGSGEGPSSEMISDTGPDPSGRQG
ncbi:MAG: hypothetical protein RQM90_02470 [Methanoculleus sp.]